MNWPQITILCLIVLRALVGILTLGRDDDMTSGQQVFGGVILVLFWFAVAGVLSQGGFW